MGKFQQISDGFPGKAPNPHFRAGGDVASAFTRAKSQARKERDRLFRLGELRCTICPFSPVVAAQIEAHHLEGSLLDRDHDLYVWLCSCCHTLVEHYIRCLSPLLTPVGFGHALGEFVAEGRHPAYWPSGVPVVQVDQLSLEFAA